MSLKETILQILSDRNIEIDKESSVVDEYVRLCHNFNKTPEILCDDIEAKLTDDTSLNVLSKSFVGNLERQYKQETRKRVSTKKKIQKKKEETQQPRRVSLIESNDNSNQKNPRQTPNRITPVAQNEFATPSFTPFTRQAQQFNPQNITYVDFTPSKNMELEIHSREKTLISFNCNSKSVFPHIQEDNELDIQIIQGIDPSKEKYMNDTVVSRHRELVNHVVDLSEYILTKNKISENMIRPINCLPNTEGIFWGRILCDAAGGNEKLNDGSILIESFKESKDEVGSGNQNLSTSSNEPVLSKSRCVRLDISQLKQPNVLFFPGQVAAVRGKMASSPRRIVVEQVYNGVLPRISVSPQEPEKGFSIIVAAGPFTTSNNLDYHAFNTLLKVTIKRKPDLLLLIGPFVDSENSLVKKDSLGHDFDDVFVEKFLGMLRSAKISPSTRVGIVPSLRDVHHDYVYPQPPFSKEDFPILDDNRFILLSNPCLFTVNGVTIGVNSHDVISQVRGKSYCKQPFDDRILKFVVMENLTRQNSFYPPFFATKQVPLDYSLSDRLKFPEGKLPALLITPSSSRPSVCLSGDVLFLNPNFLVRGNKAGSYSHVHFPEKCFEVDIPDDVFDIDDVDDDDDEDKMDTSEDGEKKKEEIVKKSVGEKKDEIIDHKKKIQIQIIET